VRRLTVLLAGLVSAFALVPGGAALAGTQGARAVLTHQGVVTRQDIPSRAGSETDTVVEPDVAVDPLDGRIAIAAAHDSRYSDGGAVDISVAWTRNGGRTWQHKPIRGITKAAGGTWARASDPVLAFGPDGTAYLSVLAVSLKCPSAVVVLRSHDGGQHWSKPVYAHKSTSCAYSDDKNWLVVDRSKASPHYGRVYQFWTPFISRGNTAVGSPQVVRWSDDHGRTWSSTHNVLADNHGTQNSQPMILPNGTIVDTFYDYGAGWHVPDSVGGTPEAVGAKQRRVYAAPRAPINAKGSVYAATSTDGGATWSREHEVVNNAGGYAGGVRCCLFAADIDAVTHRMYVAYEGGVRDTDPVYLSWSSDGTQWSSPTQVSRGDRSGVQRVNVDVVARAGHVYVSYGRRTDAEQSGGYVQQQLSSSGNGGRTFAAPVSIGPRSVLKYAAQAGGYFPGDYIGEALTPKRLYIVWAVSSKQPATSTSKYHQVIFGATLRP
jgi:hypothetical protein